MERSELIRVARSINSRDAEMLILLLKEDKPVNSIYHFLDLKADLDIELRKLGFDGKID